ncbi:MAG: RNA methyltransferase [Oscillospiraceae bacterium]|jgi:TrmH family RNA methyltransferase|nr:RNA methyltransferase [Oscillospiraceae bacterium]
MATEIRSKDNQAVKTAARLMTDAKERRESNLFIAEGVRLCTEALQNNIEITELFYTEEALTKYNDTIKALEKAAEKAYIITEELSLKISDTQSPQGIFCIGKIKSETINLEEMKTDGQYVLLENLQDPANVGAIFRTAEALGLSGAFLSGDCCDIFNPKAMRASMGAVFRLPFAVLNDVPESIVRFKKSNMRPLAAVPDSEASKITGVRFFKGVVMCIGNEGNGLTQKTIEACGERVTIPMNGRAESLNAATAAALLMWEMVRNYAV